MKKAYGKPVAVAARVEKRDIIIMAEVDKKDLSIAQEALERAQHKLPLPVRILIKEN
jgi:ribosomal protein L16/L10AE